ncbi:MAG: DUF5106 domain-containing protein, partial [Bacteroidetes bacterium]|nr:DUF5106 domain-containing protein [Bacteroidota bacterium]
MFEIRKRLLVSVLILFPILFQTNFSSADVGDPDPIKVTVKVKGITDSVCQLAYHYGNKTYIHTKKIMPDDKGVYQIESDSMPGGIYLFVLPDKSYFEFIVSGKEKNISLETVAGDYVMPMKIKGSKENEIFFRNLRFLDKQQKVIKKVNKWLKKNDPKKDEDGKKPKVRKKIQDSIKIMKDRIREIDQEVKNSRLTIIEEHPDAFYTVILKAMQEIDIPDAPKDEDGNVTDSTFQYRYYRSHFFDNMDFADDRILRTPIYHKRIIKFITQMVPKNPDSLNVALDWLLAKTRANDEVKKYTLITFLNRYASSKIMGMDGVYVHLALNYYCKGEAPWMDSTALWRMCDAANTMERVLIGKIAPDLNMEKVNGGYSRLHAVEADFTILTFWDPDCGHCKKSIPRLKELHDKFKTRGVKVYAVCTEVEIN